MRPFAPEVEAALRVRAKAELRTSLQRTRRATPAAARARGSVEICRRILAQKMLDGARNVALFRPIARKGEVDLAELDAALRARGVRIAYPSSVVASAVVATDDAPLAQTSVPPPWGEMALRWVDLAGAMPLAAAFA